MNTIKIFTRTMVPTLALLFSLTACGEADKGGKKGADKTAKGGDKTKPEVDKPEVDEPEVEVPALDPRVEKAVTLANKLAAEPSRADAILEEAGEDRSSFDAMLYEIAHDPELAKSYAIARDA